MVSENASFPIAIPAKYQNAVARWHLPVRISTPGQQTTITARVIYAYMSSVVRVEMRVSDKR